VRKLLLVFLIVLPCVVLAQNKKGKKTPKVIEWSDGEGTFRIYPNHVTVIGGGEYTAPKEEPKAKAKTENKNGAFLDIGHKTGKVSIDCKCKGKALKGKVKVVDCNPDFRVQIVNGVSDMKIRVVDYPPYYCGEWQFVECSPDFTIQYVDGAPDFTIKFVDDCPGRQ